MIHLDAWSLTDLGTPIPLYASAPLSELKQPLLLMGGVHGDEPLGVHLAQQTLEFLKEFEVSIRQPWILIPCLNVDGYSRNTRVNGRGVETLVAGGRGVERSLEALCTVLPRARAHCLEGRVVDWRRQPYAGGGFPFVPVGVRRQATPAAGPVRFAGDWTANWMGFVEGALESAERVVAEISHEHGLS